MFVPILLGTGREGNNSEKIAEVIFAWVKEYGFETELVRPKDYLEKPFTIGMLETKRNQWSEIMQKADGLLIVSPEYNHSFPGELKLMLDELYEEYNYKPCGICGVSKGVLGGARMVESLRLVLIELKMIPVREAVYFLEVENLLAEKEKLTVYKPRVFKLLEEIKSFLS